MIYDIPKEFLFQVYNTLESKVFSIRNRRTEISLNDIHEMNYFKACYNLKKSNIPKESPKIKEAERLYSQGEIFKASKILIKLVKEVDFLSNLKKEELPEEIKNNVSIN